MSLDWLDDQPVRLLKETGAIKGWRAAPNSRIVQFYRDKCVLVTGATGFLGKLLVEKLLRACPDLDTIFIVVRPKKGEDAHSRVDKLYSDPVFGPLAEMCPKFQQKIRIVKGDVAMPDLELDPSDRQLLIDRVNVIFHIAATVRFDEKIDTAVAINVRGTRDLLKLAKECKQFESFVHVSTAYTNCNRKEIFEEFYQPPITSDALIELIEQSDEDTLHKITPKLIQDWPNTYTYTKFMSEDAVKKYGADLPVCVFRPAIVVATYAEPLRSWIDNLYGATGILVGAGVGLLRSINCDQHKAAEIVPADYVINAMIAASYNNTLTKNKMAVYNYVSSAENRITWRELMNESKYWGCSTPSMRCIWYYSLTLNRYKWMHFLYCIFLHFLPAILMDIGLIVTGKAPLMVKIYRKITKFESVIAHFAKNEWRFHNGNVQKLWQGLEEADHKTFPFSMKEMPWRDFHKTHLLGIRIHLLKDDVSTMAESRRRWVKLYIGHCIVRIIFYAVILRLLYAIVTRLYEMI